MQTSVELQTPFSYSLVYICIVFIITSIFTIYIIIKRCNNKEIKKSVHDANNKLELNEVLNIKNKYLKKIDVIKNNVENKKITNRKAYQSISNIIRHFVYEVTAIRVQKYTLSEIEKLDMPMLYELVSEYYEPEFSKNSVGDIKSSIDKTRKVIEKWN